MSSILKIKVDLQCQVFCDFEQIGETQANSIFKMELRKGTYILEFKIDGITIMSKEYIMKSDNEEDLLKINLSEAFSIYMREKKYSEIANTSADIKYKDNGWWIINKDNGCEIRLWYNIEDYSSFSKLNTFDKVGLRAVNIGGVEKDNVVCFSIEGGKWGCINKCGEIQIPIIYDSSIYFYNDRVAKATLNGKDILINKYGEQLYADLYDDLIGYFSINQIVCKNGKYGLINTNGTYTIPLIYKSLERLKDSDTLFIFNIDEKYGIIDCNNNLILPCIYDSIVSGRHVISVCSDNRWGILNYDLEIIVPIGYEIRDIDIKNKYYNNMKPILVRKNNYYGILNINISNPENISTWDGKLKLISEIIPCTYDALYDEYGHKIDFFKDNSNLINNVFFVNESSEKLDCYKYEVKESSSLQYIANCSLHFSCKGFCKIYGTPYNEYYVLENDGVCTIIAGNVHIKVSCKKEEIKDIILLPDESKYIVIIDKQILLFEGEKLILSMDNAELCYTRLGGNIYGVKQHGKYAIFTPNFCQCTDFEYDNIYKEDDCENISVMKKLHDRNLYGEFSYDAAALISFGYLRPMHFRSHHNWAEKYDITTKKEGIISLNPQRIIIPFNYDYIRFYTGQRSTVLVVSKEFDNYPHRRYALMSTKLELLTNFIFKNIHERDWDYKGYLNDIECILIHDDIYADFNLSLNNIEEFAPFLGYEHNIADEYDDNNRPKRLHNESATPFKNVRLFIDTETTGLPLNDKAAYTNLDNWPYLVQVALIIEDDNYGILAKRNIILKPDGYSIPESSARIHGISNTKAVKEGEDRKQVICFLDTVLYNSDIIIGHNILFDLNVVKAEIIRVKGIENALFVKKEPNIMDTMKMGTNVCKIPNLYFYSRQDQPYKYPKLDELYYKLFHKHFDDQHDAMSDIQATYDCYYELKKNSI